MSNRSQPRTAIVGDGQMGQVMAAILAGLGRPVCLTGPFHEPLEAMARDRRSDRLPGFRLPDGVEIEIDPVAAVAGADLVMNAVPTQYIRRVWAGIADAVDSRAVVVSVAKGVENETMLRPSEILAELLGDQDGARQVVLSGPTIAAELARELPATMVAAGRREAHARRVQEAFSCPYLRIYTNPDVIGVELAGATKNVIALAAGMSEGLGLGFNAKSALLARGLAEITRFGVAMGAAPETFFGIAGVGDLATTCFSPEGRNRTCGERLGRGETLEEILASSHSVVEGVPTTRSLVTIAARLQLDLPITTAVHAILFDGLSPSDAIAGLMSRELKAERIG